MPRQGAERLASGEPCDDGWRAVEPEGDHAHDDAARIAACAGAAARCRTGSQCARMLTEEVAQPTAFGAHGSFSYEIDARVLHAQ